MRGLQGHDTADHQGAEGQQEGAVHQEPVLRLAFLCITGQKRNVSRQRKKSVTGQEKNVSRKKREIGLEERRKIVGLSTGVCKKVYNVLCRLSFVLCTRIMLNVRGAK